MAQCLVVAQKIGAARFLALDHHFNRLARLQLRLPGVIQNLLQRNQAFGFQAYIDHHMLVGQLDDRARDHMAIDRLRGLLGSLLVFERLQQRAKIHLFFVFVRRLLCRRGA